MREREEKARPQRRTQEVLLRAQKDFFSVGVQLEAVSSEMALLGDGIKVVLRPLPAA